MYVYFQVNGYVDLPLLYVRTEGECAMDYLPYYSMHIGKGQERKRNFIYEKT